MIEKRKNIRLPREQYEMPSRIFSITICTDNRRMLFSNRTLAGKIADTLSSGPFGRLTKHYAWCLMPDHLHLLISPVAENLIPLISGWKSYTANLLMKHGVQNRCWQRGFYDHALRNEEDINKVAEYIVNNPVRAGIVEKWGDYPFSWHKWMKEPSF